MQGLDLLLVLEQRGVRIDFHLHPAIGVFLREFLELQRALALRRVVGDDVAEFYDDLRLGGRRAGTYSYEGGCRRHKPSMHALPPWRVDAVVLLASVTKNRFGSKARFA